MGEPALECGRCPDPVRSAVRGPTTLDLHYEETRSFYLSVGFDPPPEAIQLV